MIDVSTELPNAFGIIYFHFVLSRQDATCACSIDDGAPMECKAILATEAILHGYTPSLLAYKC